MSVVKLLPKFFMDFFVKPKNECEVTSDFFGVTSKVTTEFLGICAFMEVPDTKKPLNLFV